MTPEDYLKRPYIYMLIWDEDSQTWTGKVKEFPGCFAQNLTPVDTMEDLQYAALDWIAAALDLGQEIPEAEAGEKNDTEHKYPCTRCGTLRTKAEGGTTFTVCDECWDAKGEPE